jgi:putative membrane protein
MLTNKLGRRRVMMWDSGDGMGWWMLIGSVWMILFWAVVVWAVVKLTTHRNASEPASALEIARQRYARGELSREEFEQLRRDLTT